METVVAGGLAIEKKEHIPAVSVICGLINIQCVGSSTLEVSTTCCPLIQGKKKNMSIPIGVGGSEVYECGCGEGTYTIKESSKHKLFMVYSIYSYRSENEYKIYIYSIISENS